MNDNEFENGEENEDPEEVEESAEEENVEKSSAEPRLTREVEGLKTYNNPG